MSIEQAERLRLLPPYLFAELESKVADMRRRGEEICDLSIGDPDLPTPGEIVRVLQSASEQRENQGYSSSCGEPFFREAVAEWYRRRFGVEVDPSREVCTLLGSKEGLANIARAIVNPGDAVLVPDPGYPVYANGAAILSGGRPVAMPLLEEDGYLPRLDRIDARGAKLMYLNYPNNPTGSVAGDEFLGELVDFATDNDLLVCYDNAYSEIVYGEKGARSVLEFPGAREHFVEFNSCSKTFSMTGSRLGFAVGSQEAISCLVKVKSQVDSGAPVFIQRAGAFALSLYQGRSPPEPVRRSIRTYERRMHLLASGLREIGFECAPSPATFYYWVRVGGSSMAFADNLLKKGIVVTPGVGFGSYGEGYVRLALTKDEATIQRVVERLKE